MYFPSRNVAPYHAPNRRDRTLSKNDSRSNHAAGRDPTSALEYDALRVHTERRIVPVVVSRTQVTTLRQTHIISKCDVGHVVDPTVLAYPAMIPDMQAPWILDAYPGLNQDSVPNLRSKYPQKSHSPRGARQPAIPEQRETNEQPGRLKGDAFFCYRVISLERSQMYCHTASRNVTVPERD